MFNPLAIGSAIGGKVASSKASKMRKSPTTSSAKPQGTTAAGRMAAAGRAASRSGAAAARTGSAGMTGLVGKMVGRR